VILVDAGSREYTPTELQAGLADASFGGYWVWEALMDSPVAEEERVVFPVSSIGAPNYHSYLLGINEDNPNLSSAQIQAFIAAVAEGYDALNGQPELAATIYERVIPYFPQTLIQKSLSAVATTWYSDVAWGIQDQDKHEEYSHWLHQHGILKNPEIWQQATTNRFISGAIDG